MFLKIVTTALVIAGIGMLIGFPFVMGDKPPDNDQIALAQYGVRALVYFGVACIVWIASAFCAVLLMRRTKQQFIDNQKDNMKGLIEGTLRDHEQKK